MEWLLQDLESAFGEFCGCTFGGQFRVIRTELVLHAIRWRRNVKHTHGVSILLAERSKAYKISRNASNGQYFCSLHKQSPTYNVYSASTSYSASPPSHHNVLATPPIAIPRIISQTGLSSTQMSPSTYHRSNSGISLDAASLSPLEPASPFSNSMTESMPMSRSSTNNMPSVQGHGLSSYDANTLRCYCGSEFKGAKAKNIRSNFKRHLKTKGTQIQCPLCDKVFNRQDNVQQHIRTRHVRR